MNRPRRARPVVTRSALVLSIADELARDNGWPLQQALVTLRPQGGGESVSFWGNDSADAISAVAEGQAQLAIVNPAGPLTMAYRGTGPFDKPLPLRVIAVIPSLDCFAFAVREDTGIRSLADIRERKFPLRVSVRGQRDHSTHFVEHLVLKEYGFSFEDIVAWGGEVRYDPGLPSGIATSGPNVKESRLDLVKRGAVDAIFDEAVTSWAGLALEQGMRILPLEEPLARKFEGMGFRSAILPKSKLPALPADVLTLDFSGWPIYTRADTPDEVVRGICAALQARKDAIPWEDQPSLPLERMCKDSPEAPLDVPLHPAAERFWKECGYI